MKAKLVKESINEGAMMNTTYGVYLKNPWNPSCYVEIRLHEGASDMEILNEAIKKLSDNLDLDYYEDLGD